MSQTRCRSPYSHPFLFIRRARAVIQSRFLCHYCGRVSRSGYVCSINLNGGRSAVSEGVEIYSDPQIITESFRKACYLYVVFISNFVLFHLPLGTLLNFPSPPPKASGSTFLKPLGFLLFRGCGSSRSSMTSTNSSSLGGGGALLTVSSTIIVSLLLEALRGDRGDGVRSRRTSSITTSLSVTLDGTFVLCGDGLRGELRRDGALREGDRECRRMTSSSTTDERP